MHYAQFCILALLFAPLAEAKVDLRPKGQKIEDPGSATSLLYKSPEQVESLKPSDKAKSKITSTCTDSLGMVVKQGEKGYEACLRNVNKSKLQNPSEKNPNSVGISFGN